MPIGLLIMRWDPKVGTEIVTRYPEEIIVSDETLMQVYAAHEYTGEPGMISLLVGHLNIASFYTGRDKALYIISLLNLEDDPDSYEGGLSDISRIIIQNLEDNLYLDMIPFLFQRLSVYPHLNLEQTLAITYQDEVNRLIINRLREEGVVSKSELSVWLKDKYRRGFFDIDATLNELIKKELIKETSVKGMPSELIFLISDLFMLRKPPVKLLQNPEEAGLPEKYIQEYKIEVKKFFQNYHISEQDNLNSLDILSDPQTYEILKLLRIAIVTRSALEKLRKKGVDDIDGALKKLWEHKMIHTFRDDHGAEYYCLLTDFQITRVYPKFILNTIIHQYEVKSKSESVLIEYLKVLEDSYYNPKSIQKSED
ncbi:MAG: hypothetical protein ACFFFB_02600 [Candidatus Heimdallarchaeota archaeon]